MKRFLLMFIFSFLGISAFAQKGTRMLQVSASADIPTGELSEVVKPGFGGALKGIYGVGKTGQQITLEAGYNRFAVKNLPGSVKADYSTIPLYLGYRANMGGIILEGQSGVAFNHIEAAGPLGTVNENQTAFGWAIGAGYLYRGIELDVRYQNSEAGSDSRVIRFVGIRLCYNFAL